MRWLDGIINLMDMSLSRLREIGNRGAGVLQSWDHKETDMTEHLNNSKHTLG